MYSGINDSVDLSKKLLEICTPLVRHPDSLRVERTSDEKKAQSYLITCRPDDLGRLLGRNGTISDSLRAIVNVALRPVRKKASIIFKANPESR